jgi:hypothetical protein
MEKKHIDLAFDALDITGSNELFQKIINIGRTEKIIEAFSECYPDLYAITILTEDSVFEIFFDFAEDLVVLNVISANVIKHIFSLGKDSFSEVLTMD